VVGDDCLIGDYASITDTTFHAISPTESARSVPVVLGNNVWIGRQAIVMPGVEIGDNSVIAAGSIVTRSIERNVVAAGIPARSLRSIDVSDQWRRS
jgi:maltose O-acetyltransferase